MATPETIRSPLEQVWRQIVPQGHDNTLRNAFYNIAAAVFVFIVAISGWTVYLIMGPFVQALLWAVLVGSLLHPIKHQVSDSVRGWLFCVEETQSLLSIKVAMLPFNWIDNLFEFIGRYVMNHLRRVLFVALLLPTTFLVIHYTPAVISRAAYSVISFFFYGTKYFLDTIYMINFVMYILPFAYLSMLYLYYNEDTKGMFRRAIFPLWILSLAAFASVYPLLGVPLYLLLGILILAGIYREASDLQKIISSDDQPKFSILKFMCDVCTGKADDTFNMEKYQMRITESDQPTLKSDEVFSEIPSVMADTTPILESSMLLKLKSSRQTESNRDEIFSKKEDESSVESNSNFYLKTVLAACCVVQMWKCSLLITLLPLPIMYLFIKKFASYHFLENTTVKGIIATYLGDKLHAAISWFEERKRALIPLPIRGVFKLFINVDQKMVIMLSSSTDTFVTLVIMLSVMMLCTLVSLFLIVQIQGEAMHLITMGNQLVNGSIVNNPQFTQMLPEGLDDMVSSAKTNAYQYGRIWLSEQVKTFIGETDDVKAQALEKEVIKLWDHIYQAWVVAHPESPYMGPVVTTEAVAETFDSLVDGIWQSPDLLSMTTVQDMIKDNIGTVMSVAEGLRSVLMSNLHLIISILTAILSLILGGSLSILNALLNMVVFLSALFYILSISGKVYKPVAFLSQLAPGQMNTVGVAVEEAINGVFIASFKMGAFYGMWTWMLHSLFATKIIYIPSVLGALFGAVPLFGTYWAAIPGAIELFWGHESPVLALFLVIAQLLPLSCVDTAIYSEIKGGGHPYVTGLAVAGGIFCWGVEGAILGPLVLCILLVATKMYASLLLAPTEAANERLKRLRRCQSDIMIR